MKYFINIEFIVYISLYVFTSGVKSLLLGLSQYPILLELSQYTSGVSKYPKFEIKFSD